MVNKDDTKILIKKASGQMEPFSPAKLHRSLERVKASPKNIKRIVAHIIKELRSGTTTNEIYKHAFSQLRKYERPAAGRYSLKRAIMELGPTGHPFEKLVGELLRTDGYFIEVGQIVQGICVSHEVDVIAEKADRHIMVECKFHNQPGTKSDVKVTLYVQARFEDIQKAWLKNKGHAQKFHEAWLVTNTKLTTDAIRYAECVGMKAMGWKYPPGKGLEVRIDKTGLHPVTCLTTLNSSDKRQLLGQDIVMCKEIMEDKNLLKTLGFNAIKTMQMEKEMNQLCRGQHV